MIKATLKQWSSKFDALTQRERALLAAALLGGILLVGNSIFIDLPLAQGRVLEKKMLAERNELQVLRLQIETLSRELRDPDEDNKQRLVALRSRLQDAQSALSAHQRLLVQPQDIPRLLESLLAKHASLRLLGLRTLETVPANAVVKTVVPSDQKTSEVLKALPQELVSVWKHGVEIRLKGSYVELAAYLSELEKLPQKLIWGEIRMQSDYPNSELLIRIYTYSLDQAWLKL
jgi:MSHA biogenesis protein MshJ